MLDRRRRPGALILIVFGIAADSLAGSPDAAIPAPPWAHAAAKYLDERTAWWLRWPSAARGEETSCVACHTGMPFALARSALGKVLGEKAPQEPEKATIERVKKRVANWDKITAERGMKPFYSGGRKPSALATEAVLNALILVNHDKHWNGGVLSDCTEKALSHLWACQKEDGAWLWLNFGLKPWETGEEYYGATLAAVAAGTAGPAYRKEMKAQEPIGKLRCYLKRHYINQPLYTRIAALWAASAMEEILTAEDQTKLIEEIFAAQAEDGGWSLPSLSPKERGKDTWKAAMEHPKGTTSDGYATGLTVYVLKRAGVDKNDPKLRRGVKWLRENQDKTEGTWPTIYLNHAQDPQSNEGKFMRDAATAFAALALTEVDSGKSNASSLRAASGDWPWWRGPNLDGTSQDGQAVTSWNRKENVLWKTKVPGHGHSSPIVCGERIFLTTADEDAHKQYVLAFDRKTGKRLWNTLVHEAEFVRKNPKNSYASATPACDGRCVYSVFLNRDGLHVTALDLEGKILWQTKAGAFLSQHGYGSSPVLFKSLVIINGDSLKDCFVAALDRKTGKVVWRTARKTTGKNGSYATPILAQLAGRPQLVLTGMGEVTSYDPQTGKLIWSCAGPSEVTGCTVACSDKLVFATGGFPEKEILAIRADGVGDVTKSHIVWRSGKGVAYVPSPLYHAGYLYVVTDGAVATCFRAGTGELIWQERLQGGFTSSPVLVGNLLYVTNEDGKTFVLKTGPKFQRVAVNSLEEGVLATPAVAGGRLFLRTREHLYCIGRGGP